MTLNTTGLKRRVRVALAPMIEGPQALAFLPAVTLAAFWLGGEAILILVALALPLAMAVASGKDAKVAQLRVEQDPVTGLTGRDGLILSLEQTLDRQMVNGRKTACFVLELDDFAQVAKRYGQDAADQVLRQTGDRIRSTLRERDIISRLEGARFAVSLCPVRHMDLEAAIQLASRLQRIIEEPISINAAGVYVSCSVGFCLSTRCPEQTGEALLDAAIDALDEARRNGPSAIRSFTSNLARATTVGVAEDDEVLAALENGEIQPWFQPQISTDTGRITGMEALARWQHPELGVIAPDKFLPAIERADKLGRLGEIALYHALSALRQWDDAGIEVPTVGVNFSGQELRNPKLVEKVRWELDRFDLDPSRLSVEVLETVVATDPDDTVTRNIAGLAELGCGIDLDDFGTGHASISAIRRFAVTRLKIDRSFVMKADQDPEQQRMIAAILTMAERLDLETLAEGVESVGEHSMLAQLGCGHVQGFGIARPMPFEQTAAWIGQHNAKLTQTPVIKRQA